MTKENNEPKIADHPRHFEECPKRRPDPITCMLTLQEAWKDQEHFDYVDADDALYRVYLRIPKPDDEPGNYTHTVKKACYDKDVELQVDYNTGNARWLLHAKGSHTFTKFGDYEVRDMGLSPIQVGETVSTPIRGTQISQEWFWTKDPVALKDLVKAGNALHKARKTVKKLKEQRKDR
jgi:hypothetical protein